MGLTSNRKSHQQENLSLVSPRDQLSFIFLQFQRTLVLSAIRFYERLDRRFNQNPNLKVGPHILDIEDETQIKVYLEFCEALRRKWLVRLGTWIHETLDQSRRIKSISISILLIIRLLLKISFRANKYGPYSKWVKSVDSPSSHEKIAWERNFRSSNERINLSIIFFNEALVRPLDIIHTLEVHKIYSPKWTVWGELAAINKFESLTTANIPNAFKIETFVSNNFQKDVNQLIENSRDWILFQTEPGQLSDRALHEIYEAINLGRDFLVSYGDSDVLLKDNSRCHPRFHPKWNLRYFVGEDCLRGLVIFSKQKLKSFMQGKDFLNWQEFIAELVVQTKNDQVYHIPKILFHSRQMGPTNQNLLLKYLDRNLQKQFNAHIKFARGKVANIVWPLPDQLPKVSILMPTRDRADLMRTLIDGILNHTDYDNLEIIILDNQSSEEETFKYFESIKGNPKIKIYRYDFPFNYSAINNFGFQYCGGEILALLNNDLEVINPHWLKEMVREALAPDVGIVGAKLYFKNNFIQHAGVVLGSGLSPNHIHGLEHRTEDGYRKRLRYPHQLSAVTGACMVMRRSIFAAVDGLNAKDLSVAYNDIDLCLRVIQKGFKIVWTPNAELYHLESASRPPDRRPEQIARYRREVEYMRKTWKEITNLDPYYNPNLSRENCNFKVSIDDGT